MVGLELEKGLEVAATSTSRSTVIEVGRVLSSCIAFTTFLDTVAFNPNPNLNFNPNLKCSFKAMRLHYDF